MANPIALAAALSRLVTITCPHCGNKKVVPKRAKAFAKAFRVCPRCHKQFPDPIARAKRR
jgi:transposase-like protein